MTVHVAFKAVGRDHRQMDGTLTSKSFPEHIDPSPQTFRFFPVNGIPFLSIFHLAGIYDSVPSVKQQVYLGTSPARRLSTP